MLESLNKQKRTLMSKVDKLVDLQLEEPIPKIIYKQKLENFKQLIYCIDEQLEAFTKSRKSLKEIEPKIKKLNGRVGDVFMGLPVRTKNRILHKYVSNAHYNGETLSVTMIHGMNMFFNSDWFGVKDTVLTTGMDHLNSFLEELFRFAKT